MIEWMDEMISTKVTEELSQMNERMQVWKVQEAYRTSMSIAMRRYVDKVQSPQCPIDIEIVTTHLRETLAPPRREFEEADENPILPVGERLPEDVSTEMEELMMKEKRIVEVIESRQGLNACGVDGISYERSEEGRSAIYEAHYQGVDPMWKVMKSWKEARTILLHKKGE
jgi:hypothetical protein